MSNMIGVKVMLDGYEWRVWNPAPGPGAFWLTRIDENDKTVHIRARIFHDEWRRME